MRHAHEMHKHSHTDRFARTGHPFEGHEGHGRGHGGRRRGGPGLGPGFDPERLVEAAEAMGFRGPRGRGGPRGPRGDRGPQAVPDASGAAGWFAGRLPDGWFTGAPTVTADRDEVLVVGTLEPVDGGADTVREAEAGRISRFREETREARVQVAAEAEARFGRTVSWGATCGSTTELFTTASVPVMTRMRQPERLVLDTLVDSGVARSRSDALVWAVRLVGQNVDPWLADLRAALENVQQVRARGPLAAEPDGDDSTDEQD